MRKFSDNPRFSHLYTDDDATPSPLFQVNTGYFLSNSTKTILARPWYAVANLVGDEEGTVIVPISGLDQMSDADILASIKGCARLAKVAEAEMGIAFNRRFGSMLNEAQSYPLEMFHFYYSERKEQLASLCQHSKLISEEYRALMEIWEGKNKESGWVYLLSDQLGHYKIGRTVNLTSRIKQLGTQPPFKIKLICAFRAVDAGYFEGYLHENYEQHRLNGEWFSLTEDQVKDYIERYGGSNYLTEDNLPDNPLNKQKLLKGGYDY